MQIEAEFVQIQSGCKLFDKFQITEMSAHFCHAFMHQSTHGEELSEQ